MKVLIIDFCCNAVEMATQIERCNKEVSHIYLLAQMVCPSVWGSDRVTVINDQLDNQAVLKLTQEKQIDLVLNMNSIYGSTGLFELLKENNVDVLGTNKAFADTEINKLGFKRWLMENNIRTPKLRREALMQQLLDEADELDYPVVIKPDSQFGPKTLVIDNAKALGDYFSEVKSTIPQAEKGIVFCLEDVLPGNQIIQIHYAASRNRAVITQSLVITSTPKTDKTPAGATLGVQPWLLIKKFQSEIQSCINKIASHHPGIYIGMLQYMLGNNGLLYVIENNARPAAGNRYASWGDVISIFEQLRAGDIKSVHEELYEHEGSQYAIGAPLAHHTESLTLNDQQFKSLMDSGCISPFSFYREDDAIVSRHKRIPSGFSVYGSSAEEVIQQYHSQRKKVMSMASYEINDVSKNIFGIEG